MIGLADVVIAVERVRKAASEDLAWARSRQARLYTHVLDAIAKGAPNARELASEALKAAVVMVLGLFAVLLVGCTSPGAAESSAPPAPVPTSPAVDEATPPLETAPKTGIFVDRESNIGAYIGTRNTPYWDLQEAINEAAKLPREQRHIYICAGTYEYVVIPRTTGFGGNQPEDGGYDLHGGYRCGDWAKTDSAKTMLTGVTMRIEQGLMLHDVTVSGHFNYWHGGEQHGDL